MITLNGLYCITVKRIKTRENKEFHMITLSGLYCTTVKRIKAIGIELNIRKEGITEREIEIGDGDHVALADVIIAAVLLERGLEYLGRLLLIENGEIVDVGQRSSGLGHARLPLHQRVRHPELDGRLNVPRPFLFSVFINS